MNFIRTLPLFILELVTLWFALWIISSNWVLPELNYGGDAGTWAWLLLLSVFSLNLIVYLLLLALISTKGGVISFRAHNKKVSKLLFAFVLLGSVVLALTVGRSFGSAYIFILPFILFLLHLGIAKLIAGKKT